MGDELIKIGELITKNPDICVNFAHFLKQLKPVR